MIQASELRVGNHINTPDGIGVVDGLATYYKKPVISVAGYSYIQQSVSGIPLTEELLLKMGFVYRFDQYHFEVDAAEYIIEQQDDWFFIGIKSGKSIVYFVWHLYYLHEFQNAVYILTGQELTLS